MIGIPIPACRMQSKSWKEKIKGNFSAFLLAAVAIGTVLYGLLGHALIRWAYFRESAGWLDRFFEGRRVLPLEEYLTEADGWLLWLAGGGFVVASALVLGITRKVFASAGAFFLISFLVFLLFEALPGLASAIHLDNTPYYAYLSRNVRDEKLVFRTRPHFRMKRENYKGELYSDLYGVEAPSYAYEMTTDSSGFRNPEGRTTAEIVLLGDSTMEYGENDEDSFSRRLERTSGITTLNFGLGHYGPFQYLELMQTYGLAARPRIVLFCYSEGTDLSDVHEYLHWKATGKYYNSLPPKNLLRRFLLVLEQLYVSRYGKDETRRYPLVELELGNRHDPAVFGFLSDTRSSEEILASEEMGILRNLLREFRDLAVKSGTRPVVFYFPIAAHIYSAYTSERSDPDWLRMRSEQIAVRANQELAVRQTVEDLGIPFLSISTVFENAAKEGKFLYYPFDTHWNSEGREIAAEYVAQKLKEIA